MPRNMRTANAINTFLASGTYQRAIASSTAQTWVVGTEFEMTTLATNIVANDNMDAMYSWIRWRFVLGGESANGLFEIVIWRCSTTAALQDLNDASAFEEAIKQGRILKHELVSSAADGYGSAPRWKTVELFNVKVPDGEELRAVVRPIKIPLDGTCFTYEVLEWREVGR